jgi:FkbM family methyltransferase
VYKTIDVNAFIKQRDEQVMWRHLNGFDNGDFTTNGELETIDVLSTYYNLFIDIGANTGEFCKKNLDISKEIRVEAFEANPALISNLKNIVKNNGHVYPVAISNETGKATLKIHSSDNGVSSLFDRTMMMPGFTDLMHEHEVTLNKLDNYYDEIINEHHQASIKGIFIKIDIEGNELNAIKGAQKFLNTKNIPVFVMFEYSYGWIESGLKLKDAFHFLDSVDFDLFRVTPLGFEKIKFFTYEMEDYKYCNYLAIKNFPIDSYCSHKKILSNQGESALYLFSEWE